MMLLVNENLPASAIAALRAAGHDVLSAKESLRGEPDDVILARAQSEGRLVVTQDKDFGELAFRFGLPAQCGVILFRLSGDDPDRDIARMVAVLANVSIGQASSRSRLTTEFASGHFLKP